MAPRLLPLPPRMRGEPDEERLLGQEHVGLDVREVVAEEDAGEAGDDGADDEGLHLEAHDRLARHGGHRLVLADGAEHAAERRAAHALEDGVDHADGEGDEAEVEEVVVGGEPRGERARDPGDAVGAAGEPRLVQKKEAYHFGAAQRDDGEIVLAEPERGEGERGPGHAARHEGGGPRERQSDPGDGEQARGVGADPEEGHHAEVHEPRQPPLHVEPEGQQGADPDEGGDGHEVAGHARDPRSPCGRTSSTTSMMAKPTADL